MGKINRLDEHLCNMIAAGEVVERPSGVVKELVENAIDAEAKNIEIQITQGGIGSITIIDDGIGMDREDAKTAFERHATSKLKEEADLWNIHTMGFRGEALPSIAAVSQVVMRTNNGTEGSEVKLYYGTLQDIHPIAAPQGTSIEVTNLFQKTPARFKHLKSPQYEFSLILDIVQKFALAHPDIAFYLSHDGKLAFQTKGSNQLQEVLMQIYGRDVAKNAIAVKNSDYDYQISGYVAQPQHNRATKYYMILFVNQRMIRNYHLQKAIIDAYHDYMPKDRYPIAVLNINMDAQLVDVNVHPSKWEIRLSKAKQLEKLLYQSVETALKEHLQVAEVTMKKPQPQPEFMELDLHCERDPKLIKLHQEVNEGFQNPESLPSLDFEKLRKQMMEPVPEPVVKPQEKRMPQSEPAMVADSGIAYPQRSRPMIQKAESIVNNTEKAPISLDKTDISQNVNQPKPVIKFTDKEAEKPINTKQVPATTAKNPSLPAMEVIGQFHQSYIVAQGEGGLYIIDQHAAQERYHFEQIRNQILAGNNESQPMLIPVSLEVDPAVMAQLEECNEAMKVLGIQFERFGDQSLIVRDLPLWLQGMEEKAFLQDLFDGWMKEREVNEAKIRHLAIATMACHSSIRFHRPLTMAEMKQVVADLGKCEQPFHCPHGRPTFICMSDEQLLKQFLR